MNLCHFIICLLLCVCVLASPQGKFRTKNQGNFVEPSEDAAQLLVFRSGGMHQTALPLTSELASLPLDTLGQKLAEAVHLPIRRPLSYFPRYEIDSSQPDGVTKLAVERVSKEQDRTVRVLGLDTGKVLTTPGPAVVLQGRDLWLWPPVRPGHQRQVGELVIETVSVDPPVFHVPNFLSAAECNEIRRLAEPHLSLAKVALSHNVASDVRRSEHVKVRQTGFARRFTNRAAALLRLPAELAEDLHVLRYRPGDYYYAHHDWFDVERDIGLAGIPGNNRLATVLWYFNDVPAEHGGGTCFPMAGLGGHANLASVNRTSCERGLTVQPRLGSALFFYNLDPERHMEGVPLLNSIHIACPLLAGEKWIANLWFWNKEFMHRFDPSPDQGVVLDPL